MSRHLRELWLLHIRVLTIAPSSPSPRSQLNGGVYLDPSGVVIPADGSVLPPAQGIVVDRVEGRVDYDTSNIRVLGGGHDNIS